MYTSQNVPYFTTYAFVQGYKIQSFDSATTVTFGQGGARALENDAGIVYDGSINSVPGNIQVDISTVGLNGCYPLAISAVTPVSGIAILPVYAVMNTSGTTGGSLNPQIVPGLVVATARTGFLPAGFDAFRQVGIIIIDSTGSLVKFASTGNYNSRHIMLNNAIQVLTGGTSTGAEVILDLLPFNSTSYVNLLYTFTPAAATDVASLIPMGLDVSTQSPVEIKTNGTVAVTGNVIMPIGKHVVSNPTYPVDSEVASVYYGVTSSSPLSLWIAGFGLELPLSS